MNTILRIFLLLLFTQFHLVFSQSNILEKDSEHFTCIYRESHKHLVDHILKSAESSYSKLRNIFEYTITEKVKIITYDTDDYGYGAASTVPRNVINLQIEPFEPGYELIVYNERIQWTLNHELVHIIINDQSNSFESFFRSIFGKVPPEQSHPITTFYSLFTSSSRYTPRWHQEGIAVFLETWLSGGYGRSMGSFDEMYFRSLVAERKEFPSLDELELIYPHDNFMYQQLYYIYGERFVTYLADIYSPQKVVDWYTISKDDGFDRYAAKFETVFNIPFEIGWNNFVEREKRFQKSNLDFINSSPITKVNYLSNESFGWTTNVHFDSKNNRVLFGYHRPHELSKFVSLDLNSETIKSILTIETPSLVNVASTAFNADSQIFLYTRNNNLYYRDILMRDLQTDKTHSIFEDCRTGEIVISPKNKEIWGVQHNQGVSWLVKAKFPYKSLESVIQLDYGDELFDLTIDPSGKNIAAVLHRKTGEQLLLLADLSELERGGRFKYQVITEVGSPENPSWSLIGDKIYWNSFVSGVSNIYKFELSSNNILPISNVEKGLFKPVYIGGDSLFVFEYSTEGFIPAVIYDEVTERVPAIDYYGQSVFEKFPTVENWVVKKNEGTHLSEEEEYAGLSHISFNTLVPIITGFQKEIVLGLYTRLNDPLYHHDFIAEAGYSFFAEKDERKIHLLAKYTYMGKLELTWSYNPPDFYDLFNKRKRGLTGQQIELAYTGYWKYDLPTKISQKTSVAIYTGMESINDNLVEVSEPDFGVAETVTSLKSLRRSIGSSDWEKGNTFDLTFRGFGTGKDTFDMSGQVTAEWANFSTWLAKHNILRFGVGGGYHHDNDRILQSRFYFGGFGNRVLENVPVKQYRELFRFPGLPIYSYDATSFAKISLENNLPPLRIGVPFIGQHYFNYLELSIYTQGLWTKINKTEHFFANVGTQLNINFKHWFNLESTLSIGFGQAWVENYTNFEYFISFKLLKN